MHFSPKDKLSYNFSSTPNKSKEFKNTLLSIDKKNSNYNDYLNKNNTAKPNQRVNKLKENKLTINQSLENAVNNKSISITSFIRDENNSLHNSVERVLLTNTSTSQAKKIVDSVKNKILVLDYKDNASRNKKNHNINILTNNQSMNLNNKINKQMYKVINIKTNK